jgi:hypothetical protein
MNSIKKLQEVYQHNFDALMHLEMFLVVDPELTSENTISAMRWLATKAHESIKEVHYFLSDLMVEQIDSSLEDTKNDDHIESLYKDTKDK